MEKKTIGNKINNNFEKKTLFTLLEKIIKNETNYEIEGKFPVDDFNDVKEIISEYNLISKGKHQEYNTIHDFYSIFNKLGYTFRLRDNGNYILTLKGIDKGNDYAKRLELETILPKSLYTVLKNIIPQIASYSKLREEYIPVSDPTCTINLDHVYGKGNFVEIEASNENQINLWKERLGITNSAIKVPYFKILSRGIN